MSDLLHEQKVLILDFGSQYTQNIARKVRECQVYCEIHPCTMTLEAISEFKPKGIILSGGPSLTEQLPWVKKNRDKLIIFAVSRISRQLAELNIEPDFIFSVDPQATNIDVSKEMFQFKNSIFIHAYHADTSLINQWHGPKLYLGTRYPWKTKANPENINSTGPTVSNTAVTAAQYFGCDQILLAGFDLCYTKEGITHAAGSDEAISGPKYDSSLLQVETYKGNKRTTEPEFHTALLVLERQAELILAENKHIINLSIDSAKAKNIDYLPHDKITLPSSNAQALDTASHHIPNLDTTELNTHYQSIITELTKTIHHITLINKLSTKALKINNEMYSEQGEIKNYKDKRELDLIEKKLNKQHRHYGILVKNFGIRNFIKITSPHDASEEWTAEKTKEIGKTYYEAYQSGSKKLLTMLNDTLLRTQIRAEELKSTPDFSQLFKQWTFDKSFNRANIWLEKNSDTLLPDELKKEFDNLNNQFQNILTTTQTQFKTSSELQSSFPLLKTKATLLFKNKKIDELHGLQQGTQHLNTPKKATYLDLISAYISELENKSEQALEYYEKIINTDDSPLLEDALLRITSINIELEDHNNAHLALKCLSQISPSYLPYYADSSRILGDIETAANAYLDYIDIFPEDVLAQLKLVNLYIDIKVYEAAELMINHILTINPEHQTALDFQSQLNKLKLLH